MLERGWSVTRLFSRAAAPFAAALCLNLGLSLGLSLIASNAARAAAPTTLATCSWDRPGVNPYRGELGAAVDRYTDIPAATRAVLKKRMAEQRYDDIAVIGRDHITGGSRYSPALRDMHFGNGRVCRTVTRQRWPAQAEERGLVYCEGAHCIIVPTVCRNVSRVSRTAAAAAAASDGGADSPRASARALTVVPEDAELQFEAPGAGRALSAAGGPLEWVGPQAMTLVGSESLDSPVATGGTALVDTGDATRQGGIETTDLAVNGSSGSASGSVEGNGSGDAAFVPGLGGPGITNPGRGNSGFDPGVPQPLSPLQNPFGSGAENLPVVVAAPTAAVPEPGAAVLLLLGLGFLACRSACARQQPGRQPRTS